MQGQFQVLELYVTLGSAYLCSIMSNLCSMVEHNMVDMEDAESWRNSDSAVCSRLSIEFSCKTHAVLVSSTCVTPCAFWDGAWRTHRSVPKCDPPEVSGDGVEGSIRSL